MHQVERFMEVLSPGVLTSVQDGGRPGLLARGVPPSGAQDALALRVANLLVGNHAAPPVNSLGAPGDAGLECTLVGPTLRFHADTTVAVCGGTADVTCDGEPRPMYESFLVPAGAALKVGALREGMRLYVAISGGIEVPPYLGSRATHLALRVGGHQGRALAAGDRLPLGLAGNARQRDVPDALRFRAQAIPVLRMLPGPERELFTPQSVEAFLQQGWKLQPASNRMGFRFTGPRLEFRPGRSQELDRAAGANASNVVDDLLPLGTIQCPDGTAAIVMGVEHPTAGGYARIGTVITTDLGTLGQIRPGQQVRFRDVDHGQAREAADAVEQALSELHE